MILEAAKSKGDGKHVRGRVRQVQTGVKHGAARVMATLTRKQAFDMSSSSTLSKRPPWKRTNLRTRKRTRPAQDTAPTRDQLLSSPQVRPKRHRSVSPAPRKRKHSEADGPAPQRQRRNSAGPSFDPTPYSLSVTYEDPRSHKPQEHFLEELSHYARYNRKFQLRR